MGRFEVGTILDPDPDLFLNTGFGFGSDSDSEPVLLVLDPALIGKLGSGSARGWKSSFKISSNLSLLIYFF